ncbi:hypothetical protein TWF106_007049 [Orbilia oligospora]|uniref:Rhodopsin domain-containing protein n=1 Tax=Orbilia oligospora TaxID=2813651 RepID=A0A7C8QNZ4_ORBOL|nr:hypothetical protein TWF106_007049 [Orbilia oligospora]
MAEKWDAWGPAEKPGVYPRQNFALAVVTGTPLISLAFTSLRLHAKRKSGWGLDDLTISLATLLSIVIIYPSWRYIKLWHVGIHIWDINQRRLEPPLDQSYKFLTWYNVCNTFILPLVKASILFLLLKVGGVIDNVRNVTGIGAAKIYYTYRDRLYVSASDDWTYEIIFTINHWENCVAIVVACVPSLRVLILRWLGKEEGQSYAGSGGSPIRITGGNGPSASVGQTQKSARESFLAKLRPPPKRRGLYDTTIGDQTIDLESCVVKPRFGETIMEDDHDGASCGSKTEINFYRSASVSTTGMSDDVIEKPAPTTPKY